VFYERHALFLWAGVWVAKWFAIPVVLEVNEVAGLQRARKQTLVGVARWVERRVFPKADLILTVSSFLRDELLRRGARPDTVQIFPNAIDPARFSGVNGAAVRQRLGLADRKVIGFAGWFDRWDRLDLFVDLAARLVGAYPDLRVLLIGDGPVRVEIEQNIRRKGLDEFFLFTGPVPRHEVADYIDALDICLLPDSNLFGSPMVLFEFMALGKAVVAPDLAPIRDVLTDWKTGLIVNRGCLDSLEKAVRALLDNPDLRRRLGTEARRAVMQEHTWEASGRRIVGFLQDARKSGLAEVHR
jgi:glycosyltransferase involved in cell wall biosynthesis